MNHAICSAAIFIAVLFVIVCPAQSFYSVDASFNPVIENLTGSVNAITKQSDGKILVGGYFTLANDTSAFGLARFNVDGSLDAAFDPSIGVFPTGVRAIVVQPDGKILVGGLFATASSQGGFKNIARLNANGSEDLSFTGYTSSTVNAIALQPDGRILIGGSFSSVNGVVRFGAARLNANGTIDNSFGFAAASVFAITIQPDGSILFGGSFISAGNFARILRVNSSGVLDSTFNSQASADNTVRSIKIQTNGKIVIGGSFGVVDGVTRASLARLNADGTIDGGFNASIAGGSAASVQSVDIDSAGRILIGGSFTGVRGLSRSNVARINSDSTLDNTFTQQSGADMTVRAVVAEADGRTLIGGDFRSFENSATYRLARLNADGSKNTAFAASVYSVGTVNTVKIQPDGKLIVAGSFFYAGNSSFGSIARFNPDGTLDSGFASFAQSQFYADPINDVEIQPDGKILIAGVIQFVNSQNTYVLIRLNSNGTVDNTFSPVTNADNPPSDIDLLPNGQILVGGEFTRLSGVARTGIAKFNSNGILDSTFNPVIAATTPLFVKTVSHTDSGKIIVGGYFSTVNNVARANLARVNADGSLDTSFTVNANGTVLAISQTPERDLIISGAFSTINGIARNKIAKITEDGSVNSSFVPEPGLAMPSGVNCLLPDGRILVAFGVYGGNPANVVILNSNGTTNLVMPNSEWFNAGVASMAVQNDGMIVFVGSFTSVKGHQRFGVARLELTTRLTTPFDFDGDGKTDIGIYRPGANAEWWITKSSNNGVLAAQFGTTGDQPVTADYTGDGKTDIAFFRPSTGTWFVLRSEDFSFYGFPFGAASDVPAPADYDGDGKTDPAVFRDGAWYVLRSSDGGVTSSSFGVAGDKPVSADYDGDGKADIGIFRPNGGSGGEWWIMRSTAGLLAASFGSAEDKAVVGDYTGDGKADCAFFRPSNGTWYVLRSEDLSFYGFPFGNSTDMPAPGDYDGDGKTDAAVFRPAGAAWFVSRSTGGVTSLTFGAAGDSPVAGAYVR